MALLLSTPFVDVLVIGGGAGWLSAFGAGGRANRPVGLGRGDRDYGSAVRLMGQSRARLAAQVLAAVIGAGLSERTAGVAQLGGPLLRRAVALAQC